VKGTDIIAALKRKLRVNTDTALARRLGMSIPSMQAWKKRSVITSRQLAELVYRTERAGAKTLRVNAIRPIVEFFPLKRCESRQGAKYEVFSRRDDDGSLHPYRVGLQQELQKHHGIYLFFDSRGQAIYIGKAKRQKLWNEINSAFNRERGDVQTVKRVRHPQRRQDYRTSDEKARQIVDQLVPLHELAAYFSAYEVVDGMINDLEALLVRSFANNLLNARIERFDRHRLRA
jgi:hypothetical protein